MYYLNNNGMSFGGDMPYGMKPQQQPYGMKPQQQHYGMITPQPYGMMAPQQQPQQQPYGGSSLLGKDFFDFAKTGDVDTSDYPEKEESDDDSPLPNFDAYMDRGLDADKLYRDVSNDAMGIAQMKGLTQRGQPQYQNFMTRGSGYLGLPYGLLGG